MFYGAAPDLFDKARRLRENMTSYEKILWEQLKENKLGVRFKAQHPIDIFIADFYCHRLKLVIEVDGEIHKNQIDKDEARSNELRNHGIRIIRFSNDEVIGHPESVLKIIQNTLTEIKQPEINPE